MSISNYLINAGVAIICLVIGVVHLGENSTFSIHTQKWLRWLALTTIIEIIIDALFYGLSMNNEKAPIYILYACKFLEFSMNPLLSRITIELFYRNCSGITHETIGKIRIAAMIISFMNLATEAVALFNPYIYFIDKNGVYHRGSMISIPVVLVIISTILLLFTIQVFSKFTQNVNNKTMIGFCALIGAGYIIRLIDSNTNFDWLCISISFFILILYCYNTVIKIDTLSKLMNRNAFNHFVDHTKYSTIIFMMDINNLKVINDKFGHIAGDDVIWAFGRCILKTFNKYAYCFRLGGDEYAVILKPNMYSLLAEKYGKNDFHAISHELTEQLDKWIEDYINKKMRGYEHMEHGLAVGYAVYYPLSEHTDEKKHLSLEEVVNKADERMYEEKAKMKARFATTESEATPR